MTSKKPDDASPSENNSANDASSEQNPDSTQASDAPADGAEAGSAEADSAEAIAAAAIAAAQAANGSVEDADQNDPLGFDDARMDESEAPAVDLSGETGNDSDAEGDLAAQLAAAEAKAEDHWNRLLLLQADVENERKRTQKQVANAHKFAIKDSLKMGLDAAKGEDADLTKIVEGSELTLKLLAQAFEKFNVSEVAPLDEKFDPTFHQAMSMQEVEGKAANTVIGVMQKGYTLNERLIRPALVTVSK